MTDKQHRSPVQHEGWTSSDEQKKQPHVIPNAYNETKALRKLNDHAGGFDLTKTDYDIIEQWAKDVLKQKKYRQSIFRGIRMSDENQIIKIMDNKNIKLSTFEGAGKFAESWSTDPSIAMYFAAEYGTHRMFSILESRPNPKDIVIYMERQLLKHVENHENHAAFADIIRFMKDKKEKEVVVRTGNRKYTLCRNIVFLNIPKKHMVHKHILLSIVKRIGDEKNLARFQKDLLLTSKESYQFACGSGKFVYLVNERAAQTWMRKLASR